MYALRSASARIWNFLPKKWRDESPNGSKEKNARKRKIEMFVAMTPQSPSPSHRHSDHLLVIALTQSINIEISNGCNFHHYIWPLAIIPDTLWSKIETFFHFVPFYSDCETSWKQIHKKSLRTSIWHIGKAVLRAYRISRFLSLSHSASRPQLPD